MELQELADRQEIVDVITRYTRAVDTKTFRIWEVAGTPHAPSPIRHDDGGWVQEAYPFETVPLVVDGITSNTDVTDSARPRSGCSSTTAD